MQMDEILSKNQLMISGVMPSDYNGNNQQLDITRYDFDIL